MGIIKKLGCFVLFIVVMPILLYAGCETYYVVRNANSRLVLTPSPEIALTADYFYHRIPNHSDSVTVFIQEHTWADMCVSMGGYILYEAYFKGVSWFINNSRVPDEFVTVFQNPLTLAGTKDLGTCLLFSVWNTLPAGIHLFEVRIQTTPFDSGRSHQWAIKIEPTSSVQPQYVLQTYQNEQQQACIDISANQFEFRDIQNINFRMFANDNPINMTDIYQSIIASFDPIWTVCIDPIALSAGENRLEIRFKPLDTPVISYRWVVNIER